MKTSLFTLCAFDNASTPEISNPDLDARSCQIITSHQNY